MSVSVPGGAVNRSKNDQVMMFDGVTVWGSEGGGVGG
jgi:hypothetical protein